ncbi:hypothetical protein KKH23_11185 [Patescibacteria group bacterium]|nr:hypothetical protein [Patescibacteria group bacterium]
MEQTNEDIRKLLEAEEEHEVFKIIGASQIEYMFRRLSKQEMVMIMAESPTFRKVAEQGGVKGLQVVEYAELFRHYQKLISELSLSPKIIHNKESGSLVLSEMNKRLPNRDSDIILEKIQEMLQPRVYTTEKIATFPEDHTR